MTDDFINLYIESSMKAVALHYGSVPDDMDKITKLLKDVIKERLPKFLDEMKPIVMDDSPMSINKDAYLKEILNAEVNIVAKETIRRYNL